MTLPSWSRRSRITFILHFHESDFISITILALSRSCTLRSPLHTHVTAEAYRARHIFILCFFSVHFFCFPRASNVFPQKFKTGLLRKLLISVHWPNFLLSVLVFNKLTLSHFWKETAFGELYISTMNTLNSCFEGFLLQ